jgi:hypothetical protein
LRFFWLGSRLLGIFLEDLGILQAFWVVGGFCRVFVKEILAFLGSLDFVFGVLVGY